MSKTAKVIHLTETEINQMLDQMEHDAGLNTDKTFKQRHLTYLLAHPKVNPEFYLLNLKTMIKIRH